MAYLKHLVPQTNLEAWYSLDDDIAINSNVLTVVDEIAGCNLTCASSNPIWKEGLYEDRFINFSGSNNPLVSATFNKTIRHVFILASYSDASFDNNNRGLISSSSIPLLLGDTGTNNTKFFDNSASFTYTGYKSGVSYSPSSFLAPLAGVPELIEVTIPAGFTFDIIQIGKDRNFSSRLWKGNFHGALFYSQIQTGENLEKIRLFFQLKSQLWRKLNQTLTFPRPELVKGLTKYHRFIEKPLDVERITVDNEYADGGKSFYEINTKGIRAWDVEFQKLSQSQAQFLDAFFENVRYKQPFNFYDYDRKQTFSGVRVQRYERSHSAHQKWNSTASFTLVKYP